MCVCVCVRVEIFLCHPAHTTILYIVRCNAWHTCVSCVWFFNFQAELTLIRTSSLWSRAYWITGPYQIAWSPFRSVPRLSRTQTRWLSTERANRCAMRYITLWTISFKAVYTRFDGFSTLVISVWLICTTRRWNRGSVWGHTLFLSELIFF